MFALDIPDDDMPEYNPGGDDFGEGDKDDDLGGADAIQALSKVEKILDEKAKIKVLKGYTCKKTLLKSLSNKNYMMHM